MKTDQTNPVGSWKCDVESWMLSVAIVLFPCFTASVFGATLYVDVNSTNPVAPYTSWPTAASVIQDAVDAAAAGDTVLVTNGVYATGGRAVYEMMTNRIAVDKPLSLLSVNGPAVTIIEGYQVPSTMNGDGAIRCVYLTNGASLSGFTLTNGATGVGFDPGRRTSSGGGVWCESQNSHVSNCVLIANSADYYAGGAFQGTLNNCTLTANSVRVDGGGAWLSKLNNCIVISNSAFGEFGDGGGTAGGTLNNCTLTGNFATRFGGGADQGILNNCTLIGNMAEEGGGAWLGTLTNCVLSGNMANVGGGARHGTLNNCVLTNNSASGGWGNGGGADQSALNYCTLIGNYASNSGGGASDCILNFCTLTGNLATWGGGADDSTLSDCILTGNWASNFGGGGASASTLNNCTITGNSAAGTSPEGGGVGWSVLNNCIVYFNSASSGANYDSLSVLNYSCTAPMPTNGTGNVNIDPLFVDTNGWSDLRLQSNSPCINAGNNAYAISSTDLDSNPRIVGGTVDMGAYEYQTPGSMISYAWLQQYGLPTDGSADYSDSDSDSHTAYQEWKAWTIPTNALSVLKLLTPHPETNGTVVSWQSVSGHSYSLERSTNASASFLLLQGNIPGNAGTTSFTDTNATDGNAILYRVGVHE